MKRLHHFEIYHIEDNMKTLNTNLLISFLTLILLFFSWYSSPDINYWFILFYVLIFIYVYHIYNKIRYSGMFIKIYKEEVLDIKKNRVLVGIIIGLIELLMPILLIINVIFSLTFIILKLEHHINSEFKNIYDVFQFILLNFQVKGINDIILCNKISIFLSFLVSLLTLAITSIIIAVCIKSLEVIYIGMRGDDDKFVDEYTNRFEKISKLPNEDSE